MPDDQIGAPLTQRLSQILHGFDEQLGAEFGGLFEAEMVGTREMERIETVQR